MSMIMESLGEVPFLASGASTSSRWQSAVGAAFGPWWRLHARWQALSAGSTALLMLILKLFDGGYWMSLDERLQYAPVFMDIGRRLQDGEWLPLIDPNLGDSGNFSLDIQYGLFEPTHWLVAIGLAHFSDLALAGFVWALAYLVIFAVGTTSVSLRLGVTGIWAAAAGLAAATSGYVFFRLASPWIPGLMSIAWVPWFWWAWVGVGRRLQVRHCIAIAVLSFLVVASGWPSTWMIFGALVIGLAVEALLTHATTDRPAEWLVPFGLRAAAALAGLGAAALTVFPLANAAAYTDRHSGLGNTNLEVANFADILGFFAPGLRGDLLTSPGDSSFDKPIFFAVWFGVAVLWLVPWRMVTLRSRGVITALVGCGVMLLLTQAPSTMGPVRDQIRQLAGVQFFFAVLVCLLACAAPLVVSRARLIGVGASLLGGAWLSFARDPDIGLAAVGAVVGVSALVAALIWALRAAGTKAAGAVALGGTFVLSGLVFLVNDSVQGGAAVPDHLVPDVLVAGGLGLGPADTPTFAVNGKGSPRQWAEWTNDGVGRAFSNLSAHVRVAPGYSSIGQKEFLKTFCLSPAHGNGCKSEAAKLWGKEPATHQPWIDLLGYRTVLVQSAHMQRSSPTWQATSGRWCSPVRLSTSSSRRGGSPGPDGSPMSWGRRAFISWRSTVPPRPIMSRASRAPG